MSTLMERMEALEKRLVSVAANIVVELTGLEKHIDRTAIDVKEMDDRLEMLEKNESVEDRLEKLESKVGPLSSLEERAKAHIDMRFDKLEEAREFPEELSRRNPSRPRWDGMGTCPECGRESDD